MSDVGACLCCLFFVRREKKGARPENILFFLGGREGEGTYDLVDMTASLGGGKNLARKTFTSTLR